MEDTIDSVRGIFALCLISAEMEIFDERIENYLLLAEKKQDRNPESKTFGNFTWYIHSKKVVDLNSVDFCLREGLLLWIRHKDKLTNRSREVLEGLIKYGMNAVLTREVPVTYTNIYLIKTWNAIAYGENFNNDEIREKGYRMLDEWLNYTKECGIREYNSPNYYHVDITALGLIYNYTRNKEIKKKSQIGLYLFWTDIALNFFKEAERVGGSRSRDYDYIYGRNGINRLLAYYGWIEKKKIDIFDYLIILSEWRPPDSIKKLSIKFPRYIQRKIGKIKGEWASHYIGKHFSLGCCGFCYSPLDKPFVFLFPSKDLPNGYVVFDARNDPYAEKPETQPWAGGEHKVCLHLVPFITSYQSKEEIVMYARIKEDDPSIPRIAPQVCGFYTHFVFPNCEIFLDGEKIELKKGEKMEVGLNQVLVVKYGLGAIGIRIFHAKNSQSNIPKMYLINDGNRYNVLRLTVIHSDRKVNKGNSEIAFYVKGKDDIKTKTVFDFIKDVQKVQFNLIKNGDIVEISKGSDIILKFSPDKYERIIDSHCEYILGLDGKDIGKEILTEM